MSIPAAASSLPSLLGSLEAAVRSIRSGDLASGAGQVEHATRDLGTRPLDRGDLMILGKVVDRLVQASRQAGLSTPALALLGSILEG